MKFDCVNKKEDFDDLYNIYWYENWKYRRVLVEVTLNGHSHWLRRDTSYLSVFSPIAGKYRPE